MRDKLIEVLAVVTLAAFGGFAGTLTGKSRHEPYSWKIAIPEIIIAIFSGLLIYYILLEFDISNNIRTVAIALAGYSARGVLTLLNGLFLNHLKRFKILFFSGLLLGLIFASGCQTIEHRRYYEPNDVNMREIDGRCYGAVAEELTKSGVPDWSTGKILQMSAVN